MSDTLAADMRRAAEMKGDTYSSMEIWGLLGRGAAEIERLKARLVESDRIADGYYKELRKAMAKIERLKHQIEIMVLTLTEREDQIGKLRPRASEEGMSDIVEWLRGDTDWPEGTKAGMLIAADEIDRLRATLAIMWHAYDTDNRPPHQVVKRAKECYDRGRRALGQARKE